MRARWLRPAPVIVASLVTLFILGGWRVYETVPSLPSAPDAPVEGIPDVSRFPGELAPYDGPHPRLAGRPEESYRFPVPVGGFGPARSLFSGPPQYPFHCGVDESRPVHSQPRIDNQEGIGSPVFARAEDPEEGNSRGLDTAEVIGYSRDCQHPVRVNYYYRQQDTGHFLPLEEADGDIEQIRVGGRQRDFIVRFETGTINRYFYAIAALGDPADPPDQPGATDWNRRLIYQFRGGVGIGWRQGDLEPDYVLEERQRELAQGYAVVHSTGNQSRNHFNITLAEDTARRVKRQFTGRYGRPEFTIGIGPSGGAVQQYLLAQNAPGLLDGVIAVYAYPDMITQTIHVQDCELLEHFISETDRDNPLWDEWTNRTLVQGLNASGEADNRYAPAQRAADLLTGRWGRLRGLEGSSECISGWRGLTPLVSNPRFIDNSRDYAPAVRQQVNWSHWDSLRTVYGRDANGHAWRTWDNVGVQYGLQALRRGDLPAETFVRLNRLVGGWKPPAQMAPERFWFLTGGLWPVDLSFTSEHNMTSSPGAGLPAPRSAGHLPAMRAAWLSGEVFTGVIDVPVIDVRHYLADELDMHHVLASFTTRSRIRRAMGHSDQHVIWVAEPDHDPRGEAIDVMDSWLDGQRAVGEPAPRPPLAVDRCMDSRGETIASGPGVWDGGWNGSAENGTCLSRFPIYRTSRQVAGDGMEAWVFRCHLQSIDQAIDNGAYGEIDMAPWRDELKNIFPTGVCDYERGDAARPDGLLDRLRSAARQGAEGERDNE